MKNFFVFLLFSILISCNSKKDIESLTQEALKAIVKNDTTKLKALFKGEGSLKENLYNQEFYLIAEDMEAYAHKEYIVLSSEIDSFSIGGDKSYRKDVYFRIDSEYFKLRLFFKENDTFEILLSSYSLKDLTSTCDDPWKHTYNKKLVSQSFKNVTYTYKNRLNTFASASVVLENPLDIDIDFLKFQVGLSSDNKVFFKQTVIHPKKIFSGDIVNIDVPGISNFFPDFKIRNSVIVLTAEVIDMLPMIETEDCIKLHELIALENPH